MDNFFNQYALIFYLVYFVFNIGSILFYEAVDNNGNFNFSVSELMAFIFISAGLPSVVFLFAALGKYLENKKRRNK